MLWLFVSPKCTRRALNSQTTKAGAAWTVHIKPLPPIMRCERRIWGYSRIKTGLDFMHLELIRSRKASVSYHNARSVNGSQWKINFTLQSFSTYPSGAASFPNQSLFEIIAITCIISVKNLESMFNNNDLESIWLLFNINQMPAAK